MEEFIKQYFEKYNFDFRKPEYSRFFDQKCIPDLLSTIAEIIIEYTKNDNNKSFTKKDIWKNDISEQIFVESFSKPSVYNDQASKEYDKVFGQPLRLFVYSKILKSEKKSNTNYYQILNRDILEYISLREKNALNFLFIYINKFIVDSNLNKIFDNFFQKQDKTSLNSLCENLDSFYSKYTNIYNNLEPPRIYNKWINILAFKLHKKGIIRGNLSENAITIDEIRYNRINWKDINKDKSITREEYNKQFNEKLGNNDKLYKYNIEKAKKCVKKLHPYSEIHRFEAYPASQAHHIFMASDFPEIADCIENIICITPDQHFLKAHPHNNTKIIDKKYQLVCLLSKLDSIEINNRDNKDDYSLKEFIKVLNIGFETDKFNIQMSYEDVKYEIMEIGIQ